MSGMNAAREQSFFARDGRRKALKDELDRSGPAMLQSHVPELTGELAQRLCELAGGGLGKVYFGSSGSEGVEAAIKFARATTGRPGIVYAQSSFHGLTAGALSLMNDEFWRNGFGPFLQDAVSVPFGDLAALESALSTRRNAAFIARTCKRLRNCATSTARSTFWMRSRPECIG
jgi:ornithine--oxo-acid transaminase